MTNDEGISKAKDLVPGDERRSKSCTWGHNGLGPLNFWQPTLVSNTKRKKKHMRLRGILSMACAAAILAATAVVQAQPTNTSPDPKSGAETTGTIKEYTAGTSLVLETLAPSEPIQFKLGPRVTYMDADGKTLEAPALSLNQKVRVHYVKTGAENVADKVTIIKD